MLIAVSSMLASSTAIVSGVVCDKTSTTATTLKLKWNSFASEWGAYEVDGCAGVNPKLQLTSGTVYTWDQSDASNWYHPVGFSYVAGGAHTECKTTVGSDAVGECPELGGEEGASTLQYYVNGQPGNDGEFGLDAYEPLFFNSQDWWGEQSAFTVSLTIPADAAYTRVYYFCHIHAGMSAEIEIVGSTAQSTSVLNPAVLGGETEESALAIYTSIVASEQASINTFDEACGTSDAYGTTSRSTCTNAHFLCGAGASGAYETCLAAIDCQMHHDMAVSVPTTTTSKFATFARQMIPHHQNAVSMAKVLQKFATTDDYPPAGTEDQDKDWADGLIRNIINVQNFQIQQMQGWLGANPTLAGADENCYSGVDVVVAFVLSGTVASYDADAEAQIKQALSDGSGVASSDIKLYIEAASVKVTAVMSTGSTTAASTAQTTLTNGILASPQAFSSALSTAGLSATVESTPTIGTGAPLDMLASPPPPPPPTAPDSTPVVLGTLGVLVGVLAIFAIVSCVIFKPWNKKPEAKSPPAAVELSSDSKA